MRPFYLIFMVLAATFQVHSQVAQVGIFTGISFYPSAGDGRMLEGSGGSTFDRFVESYNTTNSADLASPLTTLRMRPTMHFGLNAMLHAFYSEFGYNTLHGRSTATFSNGNKRIIDVYSRDVDIGIGFGYGGQKFSAYLTGMMVFGFGDRMEAITEYPDGTESMGNENFLNGKYKATRVGFKPGLRIAYTSSGPITFMFTADRLREGGQAAYYRDDLAGDLDTEVLGSDNQEIGSDWGNYLDDPSSYILEEKELVTSGWSGLQLRFSVCLNFIQLN